MPSLRRSLPLFGALAALALAPHAVAKDKKDDKKDESKANTKGMSEYDKQISDAHKAFVAGLAGNALDDAIAAYRKAITLDPNRPEGHLYLAGALYQKGDYAGAEEAITQAVSRAKADKAFVNLHGKALFLAATIKEAAGRAPEDCKSAWKAYEDFAKENPDQPFPAGSGDAPPVAVKVYAGSAAERQNKLDAYAKSVNEYAKVKELIVKRQKELGIEPKPAAPPAK